MLPTFFRFGVPIGVQGGVPMTIGVLTRPDLTRPDLIPPVTHGWHGVVVLALLNLRPRARRSEKR